YEELLEVVTLAVAKLNIDWPAEKQAEPQRSKLDKRFRHNRTPPSHRSLPFFHNLHNEISRLWVRPFSARLFVPAAVIEQCPGGIVSKGSSLTFQAAAYNIWAGGLGACLHTMAVLQAYQADLLKELDNSDKIKRDDITELRRAADLSLRATKETACAIGRSMAAMVAAERHLWLTLSDIRRKTGSSSLMPRLHLLACSATPSIRVAVPSGDQLANPASVPGRSGLRQACTSVSSARKRSGAGELATPAG
ncbi:hypothetical protein M9458_041724, partial [Cirrhinus mrigala]